MGAIINRLGNNKAFRSINNPLLEMKNRVMVCQHGYPRLSTIVISNYTTLLPDIDVLQYFSHSQLTFWCLLQANKLKPLQSVIKFLKSSEPICPSSLFIKKHQKGLFLFTSEVTLGEAFKVCFCNNKKKITYVSADINTIFFTNIFSWFDCLMYKE